MEQIILIKPIRSVKFNVTIPADSRINFELIDGFVFGKWPQNENVLIRIARQNIKNLKELSIVVILFIASFCSYGQYSKGYHSLEASYIALNVADVVITRKGLSMGAHELNPVMQKAIIPMKIAGTVGVLLLCRHIEKERPKVGRLLLIVGNLAYGAVVYNNYSVCVRLKM